MRMMRMPSIRKSLDSTNGDGDDVPVEKLENRVEDNHEEMNMYEGDGETSESKNMVNQNQEENLVKESFDENTESEEESKAVSKNYDVRKREDKESKSEGGDSNSEAGETEGSELNKIEQIESEKSLDENKWMRLVRLKRRRILKIKIMTLRVVERIRLQLRFFLLVTSQIASLAWTICKQLECFPAQKHYEHRERYCPEEACTCIAPLPEGYKHSIKWPQSRDRCLWKITLNVQVIDEGGTPNSRLEFPAKKPYIYRIVV
ncbi:hypothetical protein WN944_006767 [Citrus x changshan-huyou]|uniref:Methyltransferase n=1 Tax=Citrus x changshan-huyou TaxID=2935761 RepID=A0AAP0QPW5_9ROSI